MVTRAAGRAGPARALVGAPKLGPAWGSASGSLRWALAAAVFAASFVLTFLHAEFPDDHFQWISGGRQVLAYGEWPARDFFDPGYCLQHFASAGARALFGDDLLGEALLSSSFVALGFALTFVAAARASGSLLIGLVMAALVVDTNPRLYGYYKGPLPLLGILGCWAYLGRRSGRAAAALGLYAAFAFLFRHDFGVYVGVGAAVTVLAAHADDAREAVRRLAIYAAALAVPLLPFLAFLEANGAAARSGAARLSPIMRDASPSAAGRATGTGAPAAPARASRP